MKQANRKDRRYSLILALLGALLTSIAIASTAQAQSTAEDKVKVLYFAAEDDFRAGRYDTALDKLSEARAILQRDNPTMRTLEVRIHMKKSDYRRAKQAADAFFASNPSDNQIRTMTPLVQTIDAKLREFASVNPSIEGRKAGSALASRFTSRMRSQISGIRLAGLSDSKTRRMMSYGGPQRYDVERDTVQGDTLTLRRICTFSNASRGYVQLNGGWTTLRTNSYDGRRMTLRGSVFGNFATFSVTIKAKEAVVNSSYDRNDAGSGGLEGKIGSRLSRAARVNSYEGFSERQMAARRSNSFAFDRALLSGFREGLPCR